MDSMPPLLHKSVTFNLSPHSRIRDASPRASMIALICVGDIASSPRSAHLLQTPACSQSMRSVAQRLSACARLRRLGTSPDAACENHGVRLQLLPPIKSRRRCSPPIPDDARDLVLPQTAAGCHICPIPSPVQCRNHRPDGRFPNSANVANHSSCMSAATIANDWAMTLQAKLGAHVSELERCP